MSNLRSFFGVLALSLTLFLPFPAVAQTTAGSISGQVTDPSGAPVPQATVTATNQANHDQRTVQTLPDGTYHLPDMLPGTYDVMAAASGFNTSVSRNLQVLVNSSLLVNFALKVGDVNQRIDVQATAPLLQTDNSTIGEVVDNKQVVQLPLNGRQFTQLILLTPGAAYSESGQQSAFTIKLGAGGISPAVNGQNFTYNNYTLDGMENNERFDNSYAVSPPPDAIQEFIVQSHIADARFGLGAGANVNVVTKSGSNEFHGDLWEFLRNDKLDARNYFDYTGKPPYRQNQYGLTFGGPVRLPGINGRETGTYFFGYWEGFRSRQGFTNFATVPTTAERNGDFSTLLTSNVVGTNALGAPVYSGQIFDPASTRAVGSSFVRDPFPGNIIPTSRLNPSTSLFLSKLYPTPNYGNGVSLPNYLWTQSQSIDSDQFGVRVDQRLKNNDLLYARYSQVDSTQESPGTLPTDSVNQFNGAKSGMLSYTHLFNPTTILDAKVGYIRTRIPISPQPIGTDLVNQLNFAPSIKDALAFPDENTHIGPNLSISPRITSFPQYGWGLSNPDYNYQYNFDLSKVAGRHTLSAGLQLLHWRHLTGQQPEITEGFDKLATNDPTSQQGGDGLASFLLGLPTNAANFGFNPTDISGNIYVGFVQDDFKVNSKLTVNIGLQYDYAQRPHFAGNRISTVDLQTGDFRVATTNPYTNAPPNVRSQLFDPYWRNFGPRIGIAYQVTSRTVIRTGFGTFYDNNNSLIQEGRDSTSQWPFGPNINQNAVNLNNYIPSGQTFQSPLPQLSLTSPIPPNFGVNVIGFREPTSEQWHFGIQQQLTESTTFEVDYLGSADTHVFIQPVANTALTPGPGSYTSRQPFPNLLPGTWDTNEGRATYEALQAKLTRRFSRGLSVLASFAWGRSFDEGTTRGSQAQNFYDLRDSWGPSDYDVPRQLVLSYVYDLPFGRGKAFLNQRGILTAILGNWQTSGIARFSDGTPFTIAAPYDVANVGGSNERGSLAPGQQLLPSGFQQSPSHWFNSAAVTIFPYTWGDLSRNILRGPGINDWDLSLLKSIPIKEASRIEFRSEFFNAFNRPQFGPPNATATSPSLGQIFTTKLPNRQIQFSLKLLF
jgi:Carboxypeptidase regulatory-like domain